MLQLLNEFLKVWESNEGINSSPVRPQVEIFFLYKPECFCLSEDQLPVHNLDKILEVFYQREFKLTRIGCVRIAINHALHTMSQVENTTCGSTRAHDKRAATVIAEDHYRKDLRLSCHSLLPYTGYGNKELKNSLNSSEELGFI